MYVLSDALLEMSFESITVQALGTDQGLQAMGKLAYTIEEAARVTGASKQEITEAIREGSLVARRTGSRLVVTRVDLAEWVQELPLHESCPGSGRAGQSGASERRGVSASATRMTSVRLSPIA